MNRSEEIKQLAAALSRAQAVMKPAKKDSENPYYHSQYADLASVWDAIRVPFTENGFSVSQFTETKENQACVTTLLMHISGEWLLSELILPTIRYDKDKNPLPLDPQDFGSALSYARRYALAGICGVATEDDDSEGAMGRDKKPETKLQPTKAKKILPTQAHKEAWDMLVKVFETDTERIKLAIDQITGKQSLFDCSEEEVKVITARLTSLVKELADQKP